ncbi:MAG: protein kinase domain-containing protein, partial [Candidatus Methanomethylicaceae archaeon]
MAEVIPIKDERLKRVLSYPQFSSEHYEKVLDEMRELGVRGVLSEGRVEIDNFRVLGKGCVGIVLLGFLDSGEVALKILRSDADRATLARE